MAKAVVRQLDLSGLPVGEPSFNKRRPVKVKKDKGMPGKHMQTPYLRYAQLRTTALIMQTQKCIIFSQNPCKSYELSAYSRVLWPTRPWAAAHEMRLRG